MLTERQKKGYLKDPGRCPECESNDIESTDSFDGNSQGIECLTCGFSWFDIYKLVDIVENET